MPHTTIIPCNFVDYNSIKSIVVLCYLAFSIVIDATADRASTQPSPLLGDPETCSGSTNSATPGRPETGAGRSAKESEDFHIKWRMRPARNPSPRIPTKPALERTNQTGLHRAQRFYGLALNCFPAACRGPTKMNHSYNNSELKMAVYLLSKSSTKSSRASLESRSVHGQGNLVTHQLLSLSKSTTLAALLASAASLPSAASAQEAAAGATDLGATAHVEDVVVSADQQGETSTAQIEKSCKTSPVQSHS